MFVPAAAVAKKFRYTTDYVGQLCRAGKVDTHRVGRQWYITLDSVVKHRKNKHKTQKALASKKSPSSLAGIVEKHRVSATKKSIGVRSSTLTVAAKSKKTIVKPVLRTKTHRMAQSAIATTTAKSGVSGSYTADAAALWPEPVSNKSEKKVSKVKRLSVIESETKAIHYPSRKKATDSGVTGVRVNKNASQPAAPTPTRTPDLPATTRKKRVVLQKKVTPESRMKRAYSKKPSWLVVSAVALCSLILLLLLAQLTSVVTEYGSARITSWSFLAQ